MPKSEENMYLLGPDRQSYPKPLHFSFWAQLRLFFVWGRELFPPPQKGFHLFMHKMNTSPNIARIIENDTYSVTSLLRRQLIQ
jgi:hypothetical protein